MVAILTPPRRAVKHLTMASLLPVSVSARRALPLPDSGNGRRAGDSRSGGARRDAYTLTSNSWAPARLIWAKSAPTASRVTA